LGSSCGLASVSVHRPFIDDRQHLALLEGQRYVVLRPTGMISDSYGQVRASIKERLVGLPVSYPAHPHVTLAGFPKGTLVNSVQQLVAEWAAATSDLKLEVERVSIFPTPFQTVIVQVRKTAELMNAFVSLRELASEHKLAQLSTIQPIEWIFHMSVAYCSSLEPSAWTKVSSFVETLHIVPAQCVVGEAEIVAFDDGHEHLSGVVCLSAPSSHAGRVVRL
jgi:2'-5' RNA ligase